MLENSTATAVVIDTEGKFLGLVYQQQFAAHDDHETLATIDFQLGEVFNQDTSLWEAMQTMRDYIGEAIPVIDSSMVDFLAWCPRRW